MSQLDPRIQQLLDVQEITAVLHSYCRGMDLPDTNLLADAFAEDGVLDIGPEERLQSHGAEAIRDDMKRIGRFARSSHHLSNIQVDFRDADHASCVSYILAWHESPGGKTATMMGQYHDDFVRTPRGWRIAYRQLRMSGNDAGFTLNVRPAERRATQS